MYIYLAEINSIFVKLAYLEVKYQFVTAPFSHFERTANKRPSFFFEKGKKNLVKMFGGFCQPQKAAAIMFFSKALYYLVSVTIRNKQSNEKYNGYIYFLCFRMKTPQK